MVLLPLDLPSKGIDPRSQSQTFSPFNFTEMIEYSRSFESCKTDLHKYLLDIEWVKKKFDNWKVINLVDLDYCIFMMKKISISKDGEFVVSKPCSDCGEDNELYLDTSRTLMPLNLLYNIKGVINLNNRDYLYELPTLDRFTEIVTIVMRSKRVKDIKILKLISIFPEFDSKPNDIEDLVSKAVLEDIIELETLHSMYLESKINIDYKCKKCKGGHWSISISLLIDQLFLSLFLSGKSTKTKINVKPIS